MPSIRSFRLVLILIGLLMPGSIAAFEVGDVFLLSSALPTIGEGILHIDPVSGATSVLVDAPSGVRPAFSYDASRDRLLFRDAVTIGVRTADSSGSLGTLPTPGAQPAQIAARGDGIVYLWFGPGFVARPDVGFGYLDGTGVLHDLSNSSGTGRFTFASSFENMIYDPSTNSLLCFSGAPFGPCTPSGVACAVRIPLTPAGTQVASTALAWTQVDVSSSVENVDGVSRMPNGDFLVIVDTNLNDREPRMQRLDATAMTFSTFASNGSYIGAAGSDAGLFDAIGGRVLLLDSLANVLRSFGSGEVGSGTIFATGVSAGGSGEDARMLQIPSPAPAAPALPVWGLVLLGSSLVALASSAVGRRGR